MTGIQRHYGKTEIGCDRVELPACRVTAPTFHNHDRFDEIGRSDLRIVHGKNSIRKSASFGLFEADGEERRAIDDQSKWP
jgi:hypothetical protein